MIAFRQQLFRLGLLRGAPVPPMSALCSDAAQIAGCDLSDIRGPSRVTSIRNARWAAWDACDRAGYSRSQIARYTGHDPSSVAYGIRRHRGALPMGARSIDPIPDAGAIIAARHAALASRGAR